MDCTKYVIALTLLLCTVRPRHHTDIASVDVRDITTTPVPWTSETSQEHQCSGHQRHHTDIWTATGADIAAASPIVESATLTTLISKHKVGEIPTSSRIHYKNTLGRIQTCVTWRSGMAATSIINNQNFTSLTANQRHSRHRYADSVAHTNGVLLKCIHNLPAMAVAKGTLNPNTLRHPVPTSMT